MRHRAVTLLETLAATVAALIVIGMLILWSRSRAPNSGIRLVCASNLKGIGRACKIYANENFESWPVPAFDETRVGSIDYTVPVGSGRGSVRSPDRFQPSVGGAGGARQLTVTRAIWMLIRSGDITPKNVICPTSGDYPDKSMNLERFYDFADYRNVSYGFQVPYGPRVTRPGEWMDSRVVLAADKGPYINANVPAPSPSLEAILKTTPQYQMPSSGPWESFNSPNHKGGGQNMFFADGHVEFWVTPTNGSDGDNIYTVAVENEAQGSHTAGESPWIRSAHPRACTSEPECASTDSVIFP